MSEPGDLDRLLAATVEANLRSVLVYDATPAALEAIAARLESEVAARSAAVRRVLLGGREDDGALFGDWAPTGKGELELAWRPGLLEPTDAEVVVVLPDLSRADREVRRALLTTTAGGPVHVERNGQQRVWAARLWWLIGCPRDRIGALSPHLVDRLALRLSAAPDEVGGVAELRRFLELNAAEFIAPSRSAALRAASAVSPPIDESALDRALAVVSAARAQAGGRATGAAPDVRRALTLVRLAVADARVRAGERALADPADVAGGTLGARIDAAAIDRCATALDLALQSSETSPSREPYAPRAPRSAAGRTASHGDGSIRQRPLDPSEAGAPVTLTAAAPQPAPAEEQTVAHAAADAPLRYAEDGAPVLRDAETLRLSFGSRVTLGRQRGRVLGNEPTDDLADLSLVGTILAATRRSAFHRPRTPTASDEEASLRIGAADLRRNRRAPAPGDLLVLVLDYTALDDWPWWPALRRYLQDAYVRRATVSLIQVGAAPAATGPHDDLAVEELRARRITARNVRSAALWDALRAQPGRATPLAHGLALAAETIRGAATHGRGHILRVRLVVVTDGRGNVRLADSQAGGRSGPVRAEGVRDALEIAAEIRALRGVETVVLHCREELHGDLPVRLARALGGKARSPRSGAAR